MRGAFALAGGGDLDVMGASAEFGEIAGAEAAYAALQPAGELW